MLDFVSLGDEVLQGGRIAAYPDLPYILDFELGRFRNYVFVVFSSTQAGQRFYVVGLGGPLECHADRAGFNLRLKNAELLRHSPESLPILVARGHQFGALLPARFELRLDRVDLLQVLFQAITVLFELSQPFKGMEGMELGLECLEVWLKFLLPAACMAIPRGRFYFDVGACFG